jgi:hypothetical protein
VPAGLADLHVRIYSAADPAVVFLAAVIIGLVMGGLMFLHDKSVPAAVATGLVAAGGSVPVLHKLIG